MIIRALALLSLMAASVWCADSTDDAVKAAAYCRQTGGVVETRVPVYGTNGPPNSWIYLDGSADFCRYTAKDNSSHVHLRLSTLYSTKPTLAALAYYAQVPYNGGNGAPGSVYCSQIGGTDLFGGINSAGGAWVGTDPDHLLDSCIFPDLSTIDSYALLYHSDNIVRGIDLGTVLRFPNPYKKSQ